MLWRARSTGSRRLGLLSAAYAFSAPLIAANVLMLPGIGAVAAPAQAAPWIWVTWHVGWAAMIAAFATVPERVAPRPAVITLCGFLAAIAAIGTLVAFGDVLPTLVDGANRFTPLLYNLYVAILAVDGIALAALLRRWRTLPTLEWWILAAVVALALDTLITLFGSTRFSLGFYLGRSLGVVSGVVVLLALFADFARLIRRADVLDQYSVLADNLPSLALILTGDGVCRYVNSAWTALTGQEASDALAFGYLAAIHPDDLGYFSRAPLDSLEDCEIRFREYGGTYRRFLVRAVTASGFTRTRARTHDVVLTGTDIEQLLLAQAEVNESEERLRTFLDSVPQIMWTADASGWIEWYNPAWHAYTGQTPEQAAGWGWQAAHHPDDFQQVMQQWPRSIATGEPFEMVFRLRRHDGVFQWFLTRIVPQRDARGNVVRWYGSNTNIDSQKRELQRSSRIAQIMQEAFLPERLPQRADASFDALYLPAESEALVGGDWYDVMTLQDGRVLVSCGDVVGHGLNAAVLAGRYRQGIAIAGLEDADPASVLERVNRTAILQSETIATATVAVIDFEKRTLGYALAGHPPPILATPDGAADLLQVGGLPLGVLPDPEFVTRSVTLEPNTVVVFYTDGVTEFAHDPLVAERVLIDAAAQLVREPEIGDMAMTIKNAVMHDSAPRDDVAILVLRYAGDRSEPSVASLPVLKKWRFHSSDAHTAHNARRALSEFIAAHAAPGEETFQSELVIGEAIANTVEHAPGLVEVEIDWKGERPVLIVRDTGPGFAPSETASLPDVMSEDGRGLFLIRSIADDVSFGNAPGFGMELRCTLPTRRRTRLVV